jgi:tetratricopeptide (TPR) repeat protein
MVAALFQGDMEGAESARRQRDLSNLASSLDVAPQLDAARVYEIGAYDFAGDLVKLKSLLAGFEQRARESPGLEGYYHLQVGNFHRLRGELAKSLVAYQRAFERAPRAAAHGDFAYIAMRLGQALMECGRAAEARELCERAVAESLEHRTIHRLRQSLEMMLAVAEAATGAARQAVERSERIIREAAADGIGGIVFVTLCKDQGRVAELTGDDELLEHVLARLDAYAESSKHSAFATKTAHLLRQTQARGRLQVAPNPQIALSTTTTTHTSGLVDVRNELGLCRGRGERAQKALRILLDIAASDQGFLYLCGDDTVQLAAASVDATPTPSLEARVFERLRSGTAEGDTTGDGDEGHRMRSLRPGAEEDRFDVVEVITQRGGRCRLAALAALRPRKAALDPVPLFVREALSDALIAAGDTAGIPWV